MSEDQDKVLSMGLSSGTQCAECGTQLELGSDHEATDGGTFCRPCYNNLKEQLQQSVAAQSQEINYPMALVGALAGAAIGVAAWWGFTVMTKISFGLVAVVIGIAVAKGAVILSGNKRSMGLQAIAIGVSILAFVHASYLVNRTFINQALQADGMEGALPFVPGFALLIEVVSLNFGIMELVFLGIVVYEAWKIPAPIRVGQTT